jgi:hypothetical protein
VPCRLISVAVVNATVLVGSAAASANEIEHRDARGHREAANESLWSNPLSCTRPRSRADQAIGRGAPMPGCLQFVLS